MKKQTAVITDSNSGLTAAQREKLGVYVVPMPFTIDGELYYEGVSLSAEDFYRMQAEGREMSTSQPAPGDLLALWERVLGEYEELVYIPMTSGLSGSCMSARSLAEEYGGRVQVVDNRRISLLLRQSVEEAAALRDRGRSAAEIRTLLERHALDFRIYLGVETLRYLRKGGRITPAAAALGAALQIKPVLKILGGSIDTYCKARGRRQMMDRLIGAIREDLTLPEFAGADLSMYIAYTGAPSVGEAWLQEVQAAFPERTVRADRLPLVIACHTGPGAIGVGFAKNLNLEERAEDAAL